eukprot:365219-Chlamydomonas_euryale.AAC.23
MACVSGVTADAQHLLGEQGNTSDNQSVSQRKNPNHRASSGCTTQAPTFLIHLNCCTVGRNHLGMHYNESSDSQGKRKVGHSRDEQQRGAVAIDEAS